MTVKERLSEAGLLDQFDVAIRARDRARLVKLLGHVELEDQAEDIADTSLAHLDGLLASRQQCSRA
jgi:hypothetical protein